MQVGSQSIFVTGGTGFIGAHLVRRLVKERAQVHVLVRSSSSLWRLDDIRDSITCWTADITDYSALYRCLRKVSPVLIYHLAAATDVRHQDGPDPLDRSVAVNLQGTLNVIKAARELETPPEALIRTGGLEEYGRGPTPYKELQRERPVSPYSASQVAAAHYCQMLAPRLPFSVVTLRPALIYGPAQSTSFLVPSLITHCLENRDFSMTAGTQGRDFLYVTDLIDAMLSTARHIGALENTIMNVCSGDEHTIGEVARHVVRLMDTDIFLEKGSAETRPVEIEHLVGHPKKAEKLINWTASTSLEEGLQKTIEWYRNNSPYMDAK